MNNKYIWLICAVLWLCGTAQITAAQSDKSSDNAVDQPAAQCESSFTDSGFESRLQHLLFPKTEVLDRNKNRDYQLSLRFSGANGIKASQINIVRYTDGSIDVIKYSLEDYLAPYTIKYLQSDINYFKKASCEQLREIVKTIPVKRNVIKINAAPLLKKFEKLSFSPKFDTATHFDGTHYDLWFITISHSTHYSLSGKVLGTERPDDYALINWMNDVYKAVQDK